MTTTSTTTTVYNAIRHIVLATASKHQYANGQIDLFNQVVYITLIKISHADYYLIYVCFYYMNIK